jgi:hypothetical protein
VCEAVDAGIKAAPSALVARLASVKDTQYPVTTQAPVDQLRHAGAGGKHQQQLVAGGMLIRQ